MTIDELKNVDVISSTKEEIDQLVENVLSCDHAVQLEYVDHFIQNIIPNKESDEQPEIHENIYYFMKRDEMTALANELIETSNELLK
jgi:hypothetical protein